MLHPVIDEASGSTRFEAINSTLEKLNLSPISDVDQTILKSAYVFFKKFNDETAHLSKASTPASEVIPSLLNLISHCDSIKSTSGAVYHLAQSTKSLLQERIEDYKGSDAVLFTILFDPRFSWMPNIMGKTDELRAISVVKEKYHYYSENFSSSPIAKGETALDIDSRYAGLLMGVTCQVSQNNSDLDSEILEYVTYVRNNGLKFFKLNSPWEFWRKHATVFPELAKLAKGALSIPASSVSSERMFSAVGLTLTDRRMRTKGDLLESTLIFSLNDLNGREIQYRSKVLARK